LSEQWQLLIERLRASHARLAPWYLLIASALTLASGFCKGPLRFALLSVAVILFISVTADFARSLLEKETSYASLQGPPQVVPVTPMQMLFAALLAGVYTCMISAGLRLLFLPGGLGFLVMLPCTFVLSFLAAWRNVRLWYRHAIDYEQALKEDAGQSHRLRIPPVR
jgi:hypothetical protein